MAEVSTVRVSLPAVVASTVLLKVMSPVPFSVRVTLAARVTGSLKVMEAPSVVMLAPIEVSPAASVVRDSSCWEPPTTPPKVVVPEALTVRVRSFAVMSASKVLAKLISVPVRMESPPMTVTSL